VAAAADEDRMRRALSADSPPRRPALRDLVVVPPPPQIPVPELQAQAGWVRHLARRLARDAESADDLTQGALTAALEAPPPPDRPLRPWLARVVLNLARKEWRGAARRAERERRHAQLARTAPATDQLLAELDEQQRIARLVSALREPYRTVLLLHYYREQPAPAIAEALGVPVATVRSQLARGLALLRERVVAHHGGDQRRALGALLLAGGVSETLPTSIPLAPATSQTLAAQELFVMKTSTKILAAAVCAAVVTGVLGLRAFDPSESLSPDPTPALRNAGATSGLDAADPAPPTDPERGARESVAGGQAPAPAPNDAAPAAPEVVGPTTFVARTIDGQGLPIEGATFEVVDPQGRPRPLGVARASGVDGQLEIAVPQEAFFTYGGRTESNVYMSLCAPAHAKQYLVPAAQRGARKDLGDIVLAPGGAVTGRVTDVGGAPVEGALVIATGSWTEGDLEDARVGGPDREGGRPTAIADGDGRFTLAGVHVGQALVWAGARGKLWSVSEVLDVSAGATLPGIELVLESLPADAAIEGLVVDPAGAGVPHAAVHYGLPRGWNSTKIAADATGAFLIPAPKHAAFRLMASDPRGELGSSPEQRVSSGDSDVRIVLPARRTLRIRVVAAAGGAPLAEAAVSAVPLEDQTSFMDARFRRTDADGLLELPVPGDVFRVSAGHESFAYRTFGPFDPAALPDELLVELTPLPLISGVVLAGEEPVAGARIDLVEACEERFRPLYSGFPMRLFHGSARRCTSDAEGRFGVPTNAHARGASVLLVEKEGYALTELQLDLPEPTAGAHDVEVRMIAGGALAGRVLVGPRRSPESVVVCISRGDGRPQFTRPDALGDYRFEHLTPGPWCVEDRDAEPEMRVYAMAQGDEHPLRWNCEVRADETTVHDLDLRWQDDLRVAGRLVFDGEGAADWTAVLEAPEHADRPWAARPVTLDADGRFSLEARPGYAKLVLRAPVDAPLRMLLKRDILIDQQLEPCVFELETGGLAGTLAEGALRLRLHHRIDARTHIEATFESGDDGRFAVEGFAAGEASFQHEVDGQYGRGWYRRASVQIEAGATTTVE
jgi:RNA polymerase sigma-70 factor (ECF subfamily)